MYEQDSGLPRVIGLYYEYLGFLELLAGQPQAARASMERSIAIYRDAGLGGTSTDTLGNLADATWALGDLDAALASAREALPMLRAGGYAWIFVDHLALCAALARKPAKAALARLREEGARMGEDDAWRIALGR